jgi:TolA-binding protein
VLASFCFSRFKSSYASSEVKRSELSEPAAEMTHATNATNSSSDVASATNAINLAASTNASPDSNAVVVANVPTVPATPGANSAKPLVADKGSKSFGWLAGFFGSLLVFGGLVAWSIAGWVANRAHSGVFATDTAPESNPEYDAAEEVAMNGDYLAAIQMMRDYLKRNPSEQYVAIRIAEIYEKDLNNYLAAAMELEEVLNKRISKEKWGWTAIHLANLYSGRLAKPEQALNVLRRIVKEAPDTAAAKKARERVGSGEAPQSSPEVEAPQATSEDLEPPTDPNLPRGFGPKKK